LLIITSVALLISFVACKDWKKIRHVCSIVLVPLTVSVCQDRHTDSEGGNEESSEDDFSAAEDDEEGVSGITYSRNGTRRSPNEYTPTTRLNSPISPRAAKKRRLVYASLHSRSVSPVSSRHASPVPKFSPISTHRSTSLSPSRRSPRSVSPAPFRSISPGSISSWGSPVQSREVGRGCRAVRGCGRRVRRGVVLPGDMVEELQEQAKREGEHVEGGEVEHEEGGEVEVGVVLMHRQPSVHLHLIGHPVRILLLLSHLNPGIPSLKRWDQHSYFLSLLRPYIFLCKCLMKISCNTS